MQRFSQEIQTVILQWNSHNYSSERNNTQRNTQEYELSRREYFCFLKQFGEILHFSDCAYHDTSYYFRGLASWEHSQSDWHTTAVIKVFRYLSGSYKTRVILPVKPGWILRQFQTQKSLAVKNAASYQSEYLSRSVLHRYYMKATATRLMLSLLQKMNIRNWAKSQKVFDAFVSSV